MPPKNLTILGAGPCGLYAAHQALNHNLQVTLFEKLDRPGGLARGTKLGSNWFDLGVHMLHAFDREIFDHCKKVLGPERLEVPLNAHIRWAGKLYHYPLRGRDILAGIPPFTLARCLTGLLLAEIESRFGRRPQGPDAESALVELYGTPLYEFFFEDFTHRYWGIHPRDLSAEFVRRKMPRLSAVDVVKNALEKLGLGKKRDSVEGALRFETLHYSATGSESLPRRLAADIQKRGATIHYNTPAPKIPWQPGKLFLSDTDVLLSTIPLPALLAAFDPAPPADVLAAAEQLRFKAMTVYAVHVQRERCMEALYTYYRDRIFHRVGEPKNAGLKVTPEGTTTLIVETTCEPGDPKWTGEAWPQIVQDLAVEGICHPDDILGHHLLHERHAYPIMNLGFEKHLQKVEAFLAQFPNLRTTGRQGAFTYPNMHTAMRQGATAIDDLAATVE